MPPRSRGGGRGGRGRGATSQSTTARPSDGLEPSSEPQSQINDNNSGGTKLHDNGDETTSGPSVTAVTDTPSGRSTPGDSRTSQAPATTSRGTSRFKPKNIRRDEAERKKLEEERNRDLASKIKAEERDLRAEERRARRGRGRGGMPRGLIRRTVTANGPFSAIASENVKMDSGHGGWASGSGSGRGSGNTQNAFRQDPENRIRYQPRREHEARVNIDLLNGLTDGHAPDGTPLYQPTRYSQKLVGNLPIGMQRTLHQDTELKVKTQAELEAEDRQSSDDEGNLFVDEPIGTPRHRGISDDDEVWHAAPKSRVTVKFESDTEEEGEDVVDMADIPEAPKAPKAPTSPEGRKKPIIDENGHSAEATSEKAKRREKKTAEDLEAMYSAMDIEALLRILSFTAPVEGEEGQEKDDQLFLFQLPPILPPLSRPSDGLNRQLETIDLAPSDSGPKVKLEDGVEATRTKSPGLPAEGGFIGRLNLHKSGKVELDWGGTTLNVGMGIETSFLTTATIIEQKENVETAEEIAGSAYGMGQVIGKFVLAPVWEDEDEWDPDIDEIMSAARGEGAM